MLLRTDSEREIVLEEPRTAAWATTGVFAVMAVAAGLLLAERWIAPAVLGLFALGALRQALRVHRLRLDLENRIWTYHDGFILAAPARQGSLDEVTGVFVERHEATGGLSASDLRSRIVTLELAGWPEAEGSFVLGFPMGPRVAADQAADYARRLGVEAVDRTTG